MTLEFTCDLDGYAMRAETNGELVAQVERHIAATHADLVGKLSPDQIFRMVRAQVGEEQ